MAFGIDVERPGDVQSLRERTVVTWVSASRDEKFFNGDLLDTQVQPA
jgi:hypothetical protein